MMAERGARNAAVALSLTLHGVMFWAYGDRFWRHVDPGGPSPAIVAQLVYREPTPAAPVQPEVVAVQAQPQSFKAKPLPQPKLQALPDRAAVKPEPVVEADPEPEVVPESMPAKTTVVGPVPSVAPDEATGAVANADLHPAAASEEDKEKAAEELRHYLVTLQAAIARHKEYPTLARRRGIEGQVAVSFLLLADGNVRNVQVFGGPKPLRRAAHQAVYRALRLPPPPAGTTTPLPVQYAMNFSLH